MSSLKIFISLTHFTLINALSNKNPAATFFVGKVPNFAVINALSIENPNATFFVGKVPNFTAIYTLGL